MDCVGRCCVGYLTTCHQLSAMQLASDKHPDLQHDEWTPTRKLCHEVNYSWSKSKQIRLSWQSQAAPPFFTIQLIKIPLIFRSGTPSICYLLRFPKQTLLFINFGFT